MQDRMVKFGETGTSTGLKLCLKILFSKPVLREIWRSKLCRPKAIVHSLCQMRYGIESLRRQKSGVQGLCCLRPGVQSLRGPKPILHSLRRARYGCEHLCRQKSGVQGLCCPRPGGRRLCGPKAIVQPNAPTHRRQPRMSLTTNGGHRSAMLELLQCSRCHQDGPGRLPLWVTPMTILPTRPRLVNHSAPHRIRLEGECRLLTELASSKRTAMAKQVGFSPTIDYKDDSAAHAKLCICGTMTDDGGGAIAAQFRALQQHLTDDKAAREQRGSALPRTKLTMKQCCKSSILSTVSMHQPCAQCLTGALVSAAGSAHGRPPTESCRVNDNWRKAASPTWLQDRLCETCRPAARSAEWGRDNCNCENHCPWNHSYWRKTMKSKSWCRCNGECIRNLETTDKSNNGRAAIGCSAVKWRNGGWEPPWEKGDGATEPLR